TAVAATGGRPMSFVRDPKKSGESACARKIPENLARRAFRRPVTTEDVNSLMPFYESGRRGAQAPQGEASSRGNFDFGIEQVVTAVLSSPEFLYRSIRGVDGHGPDAEVALTDLELAARLSFFLWNT